ncbi:hypothetical protein OF83DRAFT_1162184 [Amylostereum chailletii]|nr:hypothetical protein OF83DRAFT_1162184 [Amylostereum chailletii]
MILLITCLSFLAIGPALSLPTAQQPFQVPAFRPSSSSRPSNPHPDLRSEDTPRRKLHVRFLHITDIHPDPHYRVHASESSSCHRKKPKKEEERAGYYGLPYSDCDSPLRLTNFTLDFLDKHWASEIDFVVCAHDNDRKLPRSLKEIYELNTAVATKMEDVFLKRGIPVVPSMGNNDVWRKIWSAFIPFPSYQVFQRGAYFSVEVIPNQVAVLSLNTMYFYDSNKAVGGCEFTERDDPGNLQLDWMEVQLEMFRSRGMQVWLTGHHVRYVEMALRYQDTILGHLFGFFFLQASDLEFPVDVAQTGAHDELFDELISDFESLEKSKKKIDLDHFGVVNVAPSVVPNPYLPSFRVFSYNVSGASPREEANELKKKRKKGKGQKRKHGPRPPSEDRNASCQRPEHQNSWRCKLNQPWHTDPSAPSRENGLWSPLGYAQFYLPAGRLANKTRPKFKLEYLTYALERLHPEQEGQEFDYPVPLKELPKGLREPGRLRSKYAPYGLQDLTVGSWMGLAGRLGEEKKGGKLRKRFREYMYMG